MLAASPREVDAAADGNRIAPGTVTVLVELAEPPVARYSGGIAGFSATAPAVTGVSLLAARREEVARYTDHLVARQDELFERVRARVPRAEMGARYRTVWNGFALLVPSDSLPELAKLPGVAALHPVREYFPTLDASNVAMGAPAFWSALGGDYQAGAGMKIGVIDTGVDFSNPMFSDASLSAPAGFPKGDATLANGKVIVARFFQALADSRDSNADLDIGRRRTWSVMALTRRAWPPAPAWTCPDPAAGRSRSPASPRRRGSGTTASFRRARSTTTSSRRSKPPWTTAWTSST